MAVGDVLDQWREEKDERRTMGEKRERRHGEMPKSKQIKRGIEEEGQES